MVTYDTDGMPSTLRGRLEKHLAQRVRFGDEVLTRRDLYARATGSSVVQDGKGTCWLDIPSADSDSSGVTVPRMVLDAIRVLCAECGGNNGAHGMVHTRYGNGGGGNRPCSAA